MLSSTAALSILPCQSCTSVYFEAYCYGTSNTYLGRLEFCSGVPRHSSVKDPRAAGNFKHLCKILFCSVVLLVTTSNLINQSHVRCPFCAIRTSSVHVHTVPDKTSFHWHMSVDFTNGFCWWFSCVDHQVALMHLYIVIDSRAPNQRCP